MLNKHFKKSDVKNKNLKTSVNNNENHPMKRLKTEKIKHILGVYLNNIKSVEDFYRKKPAKLNKYKSVSKQSIRKTHG